MRECQQDRVGQCNTNLITCRADQQHSPPDCFLPVLEDHFVLSFAQLLIRKQICFVCLVQHV